jgi:hypothetical protein
MSETGCGSSQVTGFDISGAESRGSAITVLIIYFM